MNRLFLSTLHNRKVTLFIVFTLIVFGLISYYFLPRQENPDLVPSIALVTTVYPGAIPSDMEKLVTIKIEDAVSEISDFEIEDLGIQEKWVYDLEIEKNHNFFGNDILVHNSVYITLDPF